MESCSDLSASAFNGSFKPPEPGDGGAEQIFVKLVLTLEVMIPGREEALKCMGLLIRGGGTKWVQPLCIGSPRENGQEYTDGGLDTINIMRPGFCSDWSGLLFYFL